MCKKIKDENKINEKKQEVLKSLQEQLDKEKIDLKVD